MSKPVIHVWQVPLLIEVNEGSTHRYISEIQDCHFDMHIMAGGICLIVYQQQPFECLSVASACPCT